MNRRELITHAGAGALALAAGATFPASARADFHEYLARPEPDYAWEKKGERRAGAGTIHELHLTSQKWQGEIWTHRLQLFVPDKVERPDFCTLLNTGGGGSTAEDLLGMAAALQQGAPFAILYHIPKQPLYGGKVEDELIVHTWMQYMATGDESWPLHFPMAKAVIKAMDALQAYTKQACPKRIERFVITGASKRGWTTWLVGASKDKRVAGIAPMVIDILNVAKQIPRQLEAFGKPSEQVGDYTAMGFDKILATKQGKRLLELEDPWSYRELLTLPKLIILGTNDRYWTQDALNVYWDDLKGGKWVLYTPNSGHGLEDRGRVVASLTAFARSVADNRPLPRMNWNYQDTAGGTRLTLGSDVAPDSARLFRCTAPTKDFRDSKWTSTELKVDGRKVVAEAQTPAQGCAAVFVEATYQSNGKPYTLSTQIRILGTPGTK
ncbi:MAG: PhoPQ-activated pathogenicity-related family protein [Armatimonadota bacterium]